jgi:hypothetical protein
MLATALLPLSLAACGVSTEDEPTGDTTAAASFESELRQSNPVAPTSFREVLTKEGEHQGLFAGAHPGLDGGFGNVTAHPRGRKQAMADRIAYLKAHGVKTVLSLQAADEEVAFDGQLDWSAFAHAESPEHKAVDDAGLKFVRKAWSAWSAKDAKYSDEVIAILKDSSLRPLYVHCEYGMDRTGVVVALDRMFLEEWSAKEAFREWRSSTGRCALSKGQFDKTFNTKVADAFATTHDPRFDFQILGVKEQCMAQ